MSKAGMKNFEWVIKDEVGIYQKPNPKKPGEVYKPWQGAYYLPGKPMEREPLGTKSKQQARLEAGKQYRFKVSRVDSNQPTKEYKFEYVVKLLVQELQELHDKGKYSAVSIDQASAAIKRFQKEFSGTPIHRVSRELVAGYFHKMKTNKKIEYSDNTHLREVRFLRKIFNTAVENGLMSESQVPYIKSPKVERVRRAGITPEQWQTISNKMEEYAHTETNSKGYPLSKKNIQMRQGGYFYTMTLAYSGIRTGNELRYAKWKHVNFYRMSEKEKKQFPSMLPTEIDGIEISVLNEPREIKNKLKLGKRSISELWSELKKVLKLCGDVNLALNIVCADIIMSIYIPKENAKTNKHRNSASDKRLTPLLLQWYIKSSFNNDDDYIFTKLDGSYIKTSPSLFERVLKELDEAEPANKRFWKTDEEGRARTLYSCRHFAITEAILTSGADINKIGKVMGTSLKMMDEFYYNEMDQRQIEDFRDWGEDIE